MILLRHQLFLRCAQNVQFSLTTSLVKNLSMFCFQNSSSAPSVNCMNCGIKLPVTEFQGHQMNCCVDAKQ